MDHLPYPVDPVLTPLKIPYICEDVEQYDGLGFESFPARVGWTRTGLENTTLQWYECDQATAASRAQSWLYFGLLQEYLADNFDRQGFLSDEEIPGQRFVSSARLPALTHEWSLQHSVFAQQSFLVSSTRFTPYMNMLIRLLKRYDTNHFARSVLSKIEPPLNSRLLACLEETEVQIRALDFRDRLGSLITLSIKALSWSIRNSIINCNPTLSRKVKVPLRSDVQLLRERMQEGGSCPYWTDLYLKRHSIAMINYITALPKHTGAEHHTQCDLEQCRANNMNRKTYKPNHVMPDCRCKAVGTNFQEINSMITNDQTPILHLTQSSGGNIKLKIREVNFDSLYTAVSHVWSGGLGNPEANEMPHCQLNRIKQQVLLCQEKARKNQSLWNEEGLVPKLWAHYQKRNPRLLGSWLERLLRNGSLHQKPIRPVMFWMDTLCIPVGKEYRSLKKKAINKMDFIYSGAENVLVLDPDLQATVSSDTSTLRKSVHMMISCWMTRCWTYQEARLARDLMFALNSDLDEPVSYYRRLRDVERCVKLHRVIWNDERQLELEALSFVERLWPMTDQRVDSGTHADLANFVSIWRELAERSTSKTEDLHAIFAILLGLDPKEILELKHQERPGLDEEEMLELHFQERMKAILRSQTRLPLSLLFLPIEVPKVDDCKNHWMPIYPAGQITSKYGYMTINENGRFYTLHPRQDSAAFLIQPSKPNQGHIIINDESSSLKYLINIRHAQEDRAEKFHDSNGKSALYVFYNYAVAKTQSTDNEEVGACFLVLEFDGTVYRLIFDSPIVYKTSRMMPRPELTVSDVSLTAMTGLKVESDARLQLDCDVETWYIPKFIRMDALKLPRGEGLHGLPWAVFLIHFVHIIWISTIIAAVFSGRTSPDQVSLGRFRGLILPIILLLVAWALRSFIFLAVEMNFAHRTFAKAQYAQWASTFVHSESNRTNRISNQPFTYQYRPWWIAICVVLVGVLFLVIGLEYQTMFWARFGGSAILVETITRLLAEQCWSHSDWLRTKITLSVSRILPIRLRKSPRSTFPHPKMPRTSRNGSR